MRLGFRIAAAGVLAAAVLLSAASPLARAAPVDKGIWLSPEELERLPTSGDAWGKLVKTADGELGPAEIRDQRSRHDIRTFAVALVYARTGESRYRRKAARAIVDAIGTEEGGRALALARNLVSYVIAADLINLREYDADRDERFRAWLADVRHEELDGRTLISTHEDRPNNWGTHAGASRAAADAYLGDGEDLARAAAVFKGWLGDRDSYAGFVYGERSWQADPERPVGVVPAGAVKEGHSIGGALPEEMRRGCSFRFPPCPTGYVWGSLQGAVVQAEILRRQGYDAWSWGDRAILRAMQFLYRLNQQYPNEDWLALGDDEWQPWLVNFAYSTDFPTVDPARPGKNAGWTDWTHAGRTREPGSSPLRPDPPPIASSSGDNGSGGGARVVIAVILVLALILVLRSRKRHVDEAERRRASKRGVP